MQNQHHEQVPPMLEHLTHQMTHVALISAANGVDAYLMPSYDAALAFLRKRISGFLRLLPESAQQQQQEAAFLWHRDFLGL